jgi:hypothetical protein
MHRRYVYLRHAALHITDGAIALYRGEGWLSKWIQYSTIGPYSHAAMLCRMGEDVDVLELREFLGPRRLPLERHVRECPGLIDVFEIDRTLFPRYDAAGAVRQMRLLTAQDYDYAGVAILALRKVPFLRRLWSLDLRDDGSPSSASAAFCSEAVACADQFGGGVDAFPNKPNALVTPVDLSQSLLRKYSFTIVGQEVP